MSNLITIKKLVMTTAMLAASVGAFAHTRLQTPQIDEGKRVYNNVVIGHGCETPAGGRPPVIAHSVVFPDGSATLTRSDGQPAGPLSDYVTNWGNLNQAIYSTHIFSKIDEKADPLGNVVGFHLRKGRLPGTIHGLVPFRTDSVTTNPVSCATSVIFKIAIADICKATKISGFSNATVNLWTPAVGSNFDGPGLDGFDSPATLTVKRTSALDPSCGDGFTVTVTPTAEQLNRDMPIPGHWPKK